MNEIHVLSQQTIDKIAAGEVVERPASVAKELVENSIDAGATRVTVEIRDGGITLLRVSDNGKGISKDDIPYAFLRHATSKITEARDLESLGTLGFRGEALSSIAAVAKVELITKRAEDLSGSRYVIEGGREKLLEDIGAPDGTTVVVRDIFYNTPARAKFLKTPMTEAAHVGDFMEQLLLSNPRVAFTFIVNGQEKLSSSGSGKLSDAVFRIYGRNTAERLLPLEYEKNGIRIAGFLGKPSITRGNRNFENYYVNGRYVKSKILARGIEDGYGNRLMQHQYPFVCLTFDLEGSDVDVNVHPTKMAVRFSREKEVYEATREAVSDRLAHEDMVVRESLNEPVKPEKTENPKEKRPRPAEPFENETAGRARHAAEKLAGELGRTSRVDESNKKEFDGITEANEQHARGFGEITGANEQHARGFGEITGANEQHSRGFSEISVVNEQHADESGRAVGSVGQTTRETGTDRISSGLIHDENVPKRMPETGVFVQQSFAPSFMSEAAKPLRRLVGQVFKTYWIAEMGEEMFLFDQHAAHERVLYERFMKQYDARKITSQFLSPPLIMTLDARERQLIDTYGEAFKELGFEIEEFGESDYAVRAVPYTLGTIESETLFREFLDQLEVTDRLDDLKLYIRKVATEACKAAVKGGEAISFAEAEQLLDDLMKCDDPYHCPHGRPTIIRWTREDLDRKFKRIVG